MRSRSPASYSYFAVVLAGVVLGQSLDFFIGTEPILFGQSVSILIPLSAFIISIPLFLMAPLNPCRNGKVQLLLVGVLALWLLQVLYNAFDQSGVDYTFAVFGPLLVMALVKMPPVSTLERSLDLALVLIGGLFVLAAIWTAVGLAPWDQPHIDWPILPSVVPELSRWFAPFTGPAEGGALGALLITWGVTRRLCVAVFLITSGVVMLFFGGNLAAVVATVLGLALALGWRRYRPMGSRARRRAVLLVSGIGAIGVAGVLIQDPTLNGRTPIWSSYFQAWLLSPVTGIGSDRLGQLAMGTDTASLQIAGNAPDGHNIFVDTLTRYGPLGVGLLLLAFVLCLTLAWSSSRQFGPRALVLVTVLLTMGLTESWPRFTSATIPAILFVAACILVASQVEWGEARHQLKTMA